jgi:hypothetical protein
MGLALLALLYLGFVIGTLACGMGLYFLVLKFRGVHKLGEVPGVGEFGTLQAGSTLVMIGTYCFYYSLATYLPLQNGAVLQSRVDKLLVDTSRELRKEYNEVRNAHADPINPERFARASFANLVAQTAQLAVFGRFQTPDLALQGADTRHLSDVGRNAPEEQVSRHIESACREVALVHLRLHVIGTRQNTRQVFERARIDCAISFEQAAGRLAVRGRIFSGQLRRRDEPRTRKILVARGLGLAVPQALVLDLGGGQLRHAFETDHRMTEVGDGCVAGHDPRAGR